MSSARWRKWLAYSWTALPPYGQVKVGPVSVPSTALVLVPGLAVIVQDQRGGQASAADAGEGANLHPHGEVPFVNATAGGAARAEELDVGRVLFAWALWPVSVQGQARYT